MRVQSNIRKYVNLKDTVTWPGIPKVYTDITQHKHDLWLILLVMLWVAVICATDKITNPYSGGPSAPACAVENQIRGTIQNHWITRTLRNDILILCMFPDTTSLPRCWFWNGFWRSGKWASAYISQNRPYGKPLSSSDRILLSLLIKGFHKVQ